MNLGYKGKPEFQINGRILELFASPVLSPLSRLFPSDDITKDRTITLPELRGINLLQTWAGYFILHIFKSMNSQASGKKCSAVLKPGDQFDVLPL